MNPPHSSTADDPGAQRFLCCARSYGADRSRWPEPDRALHDAWAHTPWAQAELAAAQELDQWLDADLGCEADGSWAEGPSHGAGPGLQHTLQAAFAARPAQAAPGQFAVPARPPENGWSRPKVWLGRLALSAGFVCCSLSGFFAGFHQSVQAAARGAPAESSAQAQDLAALDPMLARWHSAFAESRGRAHTAAPSLNR